MVLNPIADFGCRRVQMEFRLLLCVTREHEPRHGYEQNDEHGTHCDAPMKMSALSF